MTTNADPKVWPDVAIPPGELLEEELEFRGIPVAEFALTIGVPVRRFREILTGRRAITAEMALAFERHLEIDAQTWMNLQTDYDLTRARLKETSAATALPR